MRKKEERTQEGTWHTLSQPSRCSAGRNTEAIFCTVPLAVVVLGPPSHKGSRNYSPGPLLTSLSQRTRQDAYIYPWHLLKAGSDVESHAGTTAAASHVCTSHMAMSSLATPVVIFFFWGGGDISCPGAL